MASLRTAVKQALHVEQIQQNLSDRVMQRVGVECQAAFDNKTAQLQAACQAMVQAAASALRAEYTVMPRFQFHQPLDYDANSYPLTFAPSVSIPGVDLPVPAPDDRMGYAPNDAQDYLTWASSITT